MTQAARDKDISHPSPIMAETHPSISREEAVKASCEICCLTAFITKSSVQVIPRRVFSMRVKFTDTRGGIWEMDFDDKGAFSLVRAMLHHSETAPSKIVTIQNLTRSFRESCAFNPRLRVDEIKEMVVRFTTSENRLWEFELLHDWQKRSEDLGWCHPGRIAPC